MVFWKALRKHKLWEAVSPKKTREGLIGGVLTSGILGALLWFIFFHRISIQLFVLFMFLGAISQVGDLIQSKIKRQFEVKDSSSLIPGHGGVYDRVDGLLFMAPVFIFFLQFVSFS